MVEALACEAGESEFESRPTPQNNERWPNGKALGSEPRNCRFDPYSLSQIWKNGRAVIATDC